MQACSLNATPNARGGTRKWSERDDIQMVLRVPCGSPHLVGLVVSFALNCFTAYSFRALAVLASEKNSEVGRPPSRPPPPKPPSTCLPPLVDGRTKFTLGGGGLNRGAKKWSLPRT
jgi:hypothetical protein